MTWFSMNLLYVIIAYLYQLRRALRMLLRIIEIDVRLLLLLSLLCTDLFEILPL